METKHLQIKWTVSRGRDTYGYNICTLRVDSDKVARCDGGGYDMVGTCIGAWLLATFPDRLKTILAFNGDHRRDGFYGLEFREPKTFDRHESYIDGDQMTLDGACGIGSVFKIASAIGVKLQRKSDTKNQTDYIAIID